MKQYLNTLQEILDKGVEKESGRANMPNTIGLSHATIKMDLSEGFPLLTTKKMFWKGIVHELLWFLRGETNIKYLVDNKVNIWNGDAYRWYLMEHTKILTNIKSPDLGLDYEMAYSMENFIDLIKKGELYQSITSMGSSTYVLGDLGKVYGYQWRNQNGVDQVQQVLSGLKDNPYSRYHIIDGWNKADFPEMALPPCHLLYQFIVRPLNFGERVELLKNEMGEDSHILNGLNSDGVNGLFSKHKTPLFHLDLNMYQRSCDTFLGVPFNIASMSILLKLFAQVSGMIPGIATWIGGDTHLYVNHVDAAKEQISREPMKLPELNINKEIKNLDDVCNLTIDDFELINYQSHDKIKAELFTGLKK
jgi:thymidylate synthase